MFFTKKEKINLENLRPLFDAQKKILQERGFPETLGADVFETEAENAWNRLKNSAPNINFVKMGNIPLLLITNFPDIKQGIEKIHGHTELDLENTQLEKPQNLFEILLDIENGKHMVAKSPKDALKKFASQSRQALTINQSIALLTYYPETLKDHYVISAGTFYITQDNELLPLLWLLDEHGSPELHYAWFHIAHGSYGTPSYATKM